MKKIIFIFGLFCATSHAQEKTQEKWHLKKDEQGITVYTRHAENSKLKELKSEFQVKTSLSSIVAILYDFEAYPEWVYRCDKAYVVKKISNYEYVQYQTVKAPWPAEDRDFVVHKKLTQDPVTKVIVQRINGMPEFIPKEPNFVRVSLFKAIWVITPLKNGMVNLEYQLLVDPGGNIPTWMVNLAVVDGPFDTEVKMKELLMREKYQKAKLPFIKEP
ncbi:MAG: START domain-containing protein [Bacteroidia bacterium]